MKRFKEVLDSRSSWRFLLVLHAVSFSGPAAAQLQKPVLLPDEIASISIPRSPLARAAEDYVRSAEPDFLFNHSVRTYVFGALRLRSRQISFNPDLAFVAAMFHDLGLVAHHSSANASFEIDGANAAEEFVRRSGGSEAQCRTVWNAIVMHDMGRSYQVHQGGEAMLLGAGAGTDVDGPQPGAIAPAAMLQVLAAAPRLDFKRRFTALAIDHCRRKPTSQIGWLDPLCRKVAPNADRGSVEEEIAAAPFAE